MSFTIFSGVFGIYEGTKLIESGAYGFASKNFRIQNSTSFFISDLLKIRLPCGKLN